MVKPIVVWRVALGMVRRCERGRLVPVDGVKPEEGLDKTEYNISSTTDTSSTTDSIQYEGPLATNELLL